MKARFIDKWYGTGYNRNTVYLEYEYRNERYVVTENMAKGNEPLSWQHKTEQARIDKMLDTPKHNVNSEPFDMDEIYEMLGWD